MIFVLPRLYIATFLRENEPSNNALVHCHLLTIERSGMEYGGAVRVNEWPFFHYDWTKRNGIRRSGANERVTFFFSLQLNGAVRVSEWLADFQYTDTFLRSSEAERKRWSGAVRVSEWPFFSHYDWTERGPNFWVHPRISMGGCVRPSVGRAVGRSQLWVTLSDSELLWTSRDDSGAILGRSGQLLDASIGQSDLSEELRRSPITVTCASRFKQNMGGNPYR